MADEGSEPTGGRGADTMIYMMWNSDCYYLSMISFLAERSRGKLMIPLIVQKCLQRSVLFLGECDRREDEHRLLSLDIGD